MSYILDPELAPALAALAAHAAEAARPARGDWQAVRAAASAGLAYMASITPASSGVVTTSFATATSDGHGDIGLRWTRVRHVTSQICLNTEIYISETRVLIRS
jgi:hypothetical protein